MVTQYGMSSLGPVVLGRQRHEVFLGRDLGEERNYSDQIAYAIDEEVTKIVEQCYARVKNLLSEKLDTLRLVAETLLEREVMDGHDLAVLLGEEPAEESKAGAETAASQGAALPENSGSAGETAEAAAESPAMPSESTETPPAGTEPGPADSSRVSGEQDVGGETSAEDASLKQESQKENSK